MPFETPDLCGPSVEVPERVETEQFVVRPLRVEDAELDYEAVTNSREHLLGTFGADDDWPQADLTLRQNRIDVAWHEKEFQRRDAFTYAVFDPEETEELGCVYVQPTRAPADAAVYFWVSNAGTERGLCDAIEARVRRWVVEDWPFDAVAYPGRDVPWSEWEARVGGDAG